MARPRSVRRLPLLVAAVLLVVGLAACNPDPTGGARPPRPGTKGVPAFTGTTRAVTSHDVRFSWRAGCPVDLQFLKMITVAFWGYDAKPHTGSLVVSGFLAPQIVEAFRALYHARFQIQRIHPVDTFGADDNRSMAANNTSAFNCRAVTGGTGWSEHSYGTAIDINPVQNPYVKGSTLLPPAGRSWLDRSSVVPGMIVEGGPVLRAFVTNLGWGWGGHFSSLKDYQHISFSGR